jgi:hypothetical protein
MPLAESQRLKNDPEARRAGFSKNLAVGFYPMAQKKDE